MGKAGPKEVDAEDTQTVVLDNGAGMVMESSVATSKVMYSNSFRVCVQHKIMALEDPSQCRLLCTLNVSQCKPSLFSLPPSLSS